MQGLITTKHLVTKAAVIIHEFGWGTYWRCVTSVVMSRRHVTFLDCALRLRNRP